MKRTVRCKHSDPLCDACMKELDEMPNNTKTDDELRKRVSAAFMSPWFEQIISGEHSQVTTFTLKEAQIDAVTELVNSEVLQVLDRLEKQKHYHGNDMRGKSIWATDTDYIAKERANYE